MAGILHDVLEDTCTTKEELMMSFGNTICKLVSSESEDKSKPWLERKQDTINHLKHSSIEVKQICCADKLSNLMSIYYDYLEIGEEVFKRFNAPKHQIRWYYSGVIDSLNLDNFVPFDLLKEYFMKVFE